MTYRYKITGIVSDEKRKDDGKLVTRCFKKSTAHSAGTVLWVYLNKFHEENTVTTESIIWNQKDNIAVRKLNGVMYVCEQTM